MSRLSGKTFGSFVVLALLTALAHISSQAQSSSRTFNPDGSFWVHGKPPNEFSDFGGINLNRKRVRHLPKSGLDEMNGRRFPFVRLSVKRERFTFTTVTVRGVSYSFEGRFLKGGNYQQDALGDEVPVLDGELKKFVAGKIVAQARLKFIYFGGT
jgi:hypothetical protein